MNDFDIFCEHFNVVDNAIQMRNLKRWNGRDVRNSENLSEHTHLVLACLIDICDSLSFEFKKTINFEHLMKYAMHHDALELLRGDILSVTKDSIPGLRELIDSEEHEFMKRMIGNVDDKVIDLSRLADLMACFKFIESELRFPSNDFVINVYNDVKNSYKRELDKFEKKYNLKSENVKEHFQITNRLIKGYANDAGTDVILLDDVVFMPHHTDVYDLQISLTVNKGEAAILCPRTSSASKGLILATCPIDPDYSGSISAIVHNISNNVITYKKGESFCQILTFPTVNREDYGIKKGGRRSNGKFGSTDLC